MKYKVSIIVPVYNVEKYLRECLDSLVNQTLKDIEIICINDASPDNSLKILKEYKKKHPKLIKIIDLKKNVGLGYARNHGLDKAQGEYISFVDSDDYVDITMCEKLYAFAKKNGADLVQFDFVEFWGKDYKNKKNRYVGMNKNCFYKSKYEYAQTCSNTIWSKFFHRSIWRGIRFPDIINEDLAVKPFVIINAKKICYEKSFLYFYRKRSGSIMTRSYMLTDHLQVFEFMVKFSKRINLLDCDEEIIF